MAVRHPADIVGEEALSHVPSDSSRAPASPRRRSDLRFAGLISAGMIATVLTLAALLAPLLAWNGSSTQNARERSQTIRLSEPPASTAPAPGHVLRSTAPRRIAAAAAGRLVADRARAAPRPSAAPPPGRAA